MNYTFALVGNPNCGKTTVFNEITCGSQSIGNWPGLTVEKKQGKARKRSENIKIIDLPSIYSLSPYSMEEIITRDFIIDSKPDLVINIVEATNLERNLFLTTQLVEFGIPVVIALNMMDAAETRGDKINIAKLENLLGIPIIPTTAIKGKGIQEVIDKSLEIAKIKNFNSENCFVKFEDYLEKGITEIENIIPEFLKEKYNSRWLSLKLLESDEKISEQISLPEIAKNRIKKYQERFEKDYDDDMESILADSRYNFITNAVEKSIKKSKNENITISDKIDNIVTNKILAIPLFLLIMLTVFQITFGTIGSATVDITDIFINDILAGAVSSLLEYFGASALIINLVVNGILAGLGSVLVFVPQIIIMFLFLSVLEVSGYMSRAAFVMDRILRKIGVTGKSFIPLLLGFGCTVPAVMASKTIDDENDKKLTVMLTPFMSCGARLPIYALFTAAFFSNNQGLVIFSIYLLGILVAILSGILFKKTLFKGESSPFVMELPPYRIPKFKNLIINVWDKAKTFIIRAGTIIFIASVLIWVCQNFNFSFQFVENTENSIFGVMGNFIAPIFSPLGFGDWKSAVAILTGLIAKEVVVTTFGILNNFGEVSENSAELTNAIHATFTPLKAYAFMAFSLLYMPCIAALSAIQMELNSWKWTLFALVYQTGIAWIIALLIYQFGKLLGFS
jgi:ferrous iron transport protein B